MLRQKLQEQQIQALKNKQIDRVNILRYILSKIKNEEIDKKRELNDEETIVVMKKLLKENQEELNFALKSKNDKLINQLKEEEKVIISFLPPQLNINQLKIEIKKIIDNNQALLQKNPKAIIGLSIKNLKSQANPSQILQILKEEYGIF